MESLYYAKHWVGFLIILLSLWTFWALSPYDTAIFGAIILAYAFYPLYRKLHRILSKQEAAIVTISIILILVILPAFMFVRELASQAGILLSRNIGIEIGMVESKLKKVTGLEWELRPQMERMMKDIGTFLISNTPSYIGMISQLLIQLFLLFFVTYYLLVDGEVIFRGFRALVSHDIEYFDLLVHHLTRVLHGLLYGQVVTSIIQGFTGGLGLFLLGVKNSLLWGFLMAIASLIPIIGTATVWLPLAIIHAFEGNIYLASAIFLWGLVVVSNIDYLVRPVLLGHLARVHPLIILLGMLAGLRVYGLVGIILGPFFLSILHTLILVYRYSLDTKKRRRRKSVEMPLHSVHKRET